jgi:hypothetical protein
MRKRIRSPALLLAGLALVAVLGAAVAFAENVDPGGSFPRRSGSSDPDTPPREGLKTLAYGRGRAT